MESETKEWVTKLCNETKQVWEQNGRYPKGGYAIFYSLPKINPTIALIGYNPGGNEEDFDEQNCTTPPTENEYLNPNTKYPMAEKVRKIFDAGDLKWALEDCVKFNLYFFRSKKASDINNKEMKEFCEEKVSKILDKIKPKYIIGEGFVTYVRLKKLLDGKEDEVIKEDKTNRNIIKMCKTDNNIPLMGITHPSSTRRKGIGSINRMLTNIGLELKQIIK